MKSKKDKGTSRLFEGLKEGLEDVIAYKKDKLTLTSEEIEIPEPPVTLFKESRTHRKRGDLR